MRSKLPTEAEAIRILAARRARPPPQPPPLAGRALAAWVKATEGRFGQGPEGLKARWREIAGERLAALSEPSRLLPGRAGAPGVLEIRVEGPVAAIVQHQAPDILARANLVLGPGAVARLRVVQGKVARTAKPTRPPRRRAAPLDAAREAEIDAGLAALQEGALKDALRALGQSVARRGRGAETDRA